MRKAKTVRDAAPKPGAFSLLIVAARWGCNPKAILKRQRSDIHDRYPSRRDADLLKPPVGRGLVGPVVVSLLGCEPLRTGMEGPSDQTSIGRIGRRRRRARFSLDFACRPRNSLSGRIGKRKLSWRSHVSARTGKPLDFATKLSFLLFQGNRCARRRQAARAASTNGWPLRSTASK